MGLEDADLVDERDAAGGGKAAVSVSCSICLEVVTDSGDRAWAKLQCGHQFHLDCIGSAFNVKGVMQCPNCRKIEKGQWLYANGCRPYPEFSMDDWAHDEDLYDLSYSESSMWCPFGGFTRVAASFDEGEFATTAYHDLVGQHAIFADHAAAVSSATHHLCPYIAYVQPVHPSSSSSSSSSTSSASAGDGPTYNNNQWNSQSVSSEYGLPSMDVRYRSLLPTSNSGEQQPSIMARRPVARSGSYVHPFVMGQSSGGRGPSSHPYPGSAARARERSQALEAYFQQSQRSNRQVQGQGQGHGQLGSSSEQIRGGIYFLPERDPQPAWGFHQPPMFRQRHPHYRS